MGNGMSAAADTQEYRHGYPGKQDDPRATANLEFYRNQRPSRPRGALIDTILSPHELGGWFGDWDLLEAHHGYIQWIFPIRESGMNGSAQELQLHEAAAIKADPKAHRRVRKAYEMMLHFYGMRLVDKETGEIGRADHYRPRYRHLNHSFHNYLRITRILKSLGELGYEHYKWPFLKFVLAEIFEHGQLVNTKRSCLNFWSQVLRREEEQNEMRRVVEQYMEAERRLMESSDSESTEVEDDDEDENENEVDENEEEKEEQNDNDDDDEPPKNTLTENILTNDAAEQPEKRRVKVRRRKSPSD